MMDFGEHVRPAETATPAAWLASCLGAAGTIGALVPNRYEAVCRVAAPTPRRDWWSAYRDLYEVVATVGVRHTDTAARAWFAVWEGHGFDRSARRIAWRDAPADDAERRAREVLRAQLEEDDRRRNAAIRETLAPIPRFELPGRTYYLLAGAVAAVTGLRYPDGDEWRNPDLFWPDDRRWFVATDVDIWSLYVGGERRFVDELADAVPTAAEPVELDLPLEIED